MTECKSLDVVWTLLRLRSYLEGSLFTVRNNHSVLPWILHVFDTTGKPVQWRFRLFKYEFDVVYRLGVKHQAADALS